MLDSLPPVALVELSIVVVHRAVSFPSVLPIISLVAVAVGPAVLSLSALEVVRPLSNVRLAVVVLHGAVSIHAALSEAALENAAVLH